MLIQVLFSLFMIWQLQKFEEVWKFYSDLEPTKSNEFLNDQTVQKMFGDPPSLEYYIQTYPVLMKEIANAVCEFASSGNVFIHL